MHTCDRKRYPVVHTFDRELFHVVHIYGIYRGASPSAGFKIRKKLYRTTGLVNFMFYPTCGFFTGPQISYQHSSDTLLNHVDITLVSLNTFTCPLGIKSKLRSNLILTCE